MKPTLVCLPFAGGYAEYYLPWQKYFASFSLHPVQLPGRSSKKQQSCITDINILLPLLFDELKFLLNQPWILYGHSMGGYIGYEFLHYLLQQDLPLPKAFVASSLPAPLHWNRRQLLSTLNDEAFEKFFLNLGGFHPDLQKHKTFMQEQMQLLRQDIKLCETCMPNTNAQLPLPLVLFSGKDDKLVPFEMLKDWQLETSAHFNMNILSGGHFYMQDHLPHISQIIEALL